ncbi:hypothetical_protein [Leishmania major strain Friedlin]|nr:hypothetical_protein [Leishmania major strain Friedlin]
MTCLVYESAEDMQLRMHEEMPRWSALAHAAAGTMLLPLVIAQSESVWCMPFSRRCHRSNQRSDANSQEARSGARGQAQPPTDGRFRAYYCRARPTPGAAVSWPTRLCCHHVRRLHGGQRRVAAIAQRVLPWVGLAPATGISGTQAACVAHAMVGGLLFKAVLAVLLERVLGSICQSLAGVKVVLPPPRWLNAKESFSDVRVPVTQHVEA